MLFLPAVDFGGGPKIGAASWQFGVAATSEHKDGATAFIEFAMQDKYLAAFSDGIGLIPPTPEAAAMSEKYRPGGPLEVFFDLSETQATLRAVTPGYVVAAAEFEKAMADIANGADVADTLDAAADAIDQDIENNGGYGHEPAAPGVFRAGRLFDVPSEVQVARRRDAERRRQTVTGWLMAAPAFLLVLAFLVLPFFMAFGYSLTNQRLISPKPAEFVGMRNFQRACWASAS